MAHAAPAMMVMAGEIARAPPPLARGHTVLLTVRQALEYVTTHAARLDYPAFVLLAMRCEKRVKGGAIA